MIDDTQYAKWLADPNASRCVLVEVVASINGVETTLYLSTQPYASDTTVYLPVVLTGVKFAEQLSLDNSASLSFGDIEIVNDDGTYDVWLEPSIYVWANRNIQAVIGDPTWARSDFRTIFNGIVADVASSSRNRVNLRLQDKFQRLNSPISETLLGGSTDNKKMLIPLTFGEVFNVTPLLSNPATLEYQVHTGAIEGVIEVRDNGYPISFTPSVATGKFTLTSQPFGMITCSVQGDKPGSYNNTISQLIQRIVTGFGNVSTRFTVADLDTVNLAAFDAAHPQPVGIYVENRDNVLTVCEALASSIGAQIILSRTGLLRLFQIDFPPSGTPIPIGPSDMLENTMEIDYRSEALAAVKLGFCKNWTVQDNLLTGIPEAHKAIFAREFAPASASDETVATKYKLDQTPVQQPTMLLAETDANNEATRQLNVHKVPRTIYKFTGLATLLALELGQAVTLTDYRYNLSDDLGMVVSLRPDWMTGFVEVGVMI